MSAYNAIFNGNFQAVMIIEAARSRNKYRLAEPDCSTGPLHFANYSYADGLSFVSSGGCWSGLAGPPGGVDDFDNVYAVCCPDSGLAGGMLGCM